MATIEDLAVKIGGMLDTYQREGNEAAARKYKVHPATVRAVVAIARKMGVFAPAKGKGRPCIPTAGYSSRGEAIVALRNKGMTYAEIAKATGCTIGYVGTTLWKRRAGTRTVEPSKKAVAPSVLPGSEAWWQARGY